MQKGRVLSLRRFGIGDFFRQNYFLILLCFGFVLGVILGTYLFDDIKFLSEYPENYINNYISLRTSKSFVRVMFSSALSFWSLLFLTFLFGGGFFGVIAVPMIIILKGFFCGGITAYLYSEYALKGIAFNAVVYIPSTIIFIIVLIIAAREAIRFSLKLTGLTLNNSIPFSLCEDFKDYGIKYIIFAVTAFLSALIDACLSASVIKYFTF